MEFKIKAMIVSLNDSLFPLDRLTALLNIGRRANSNTDVNINKDTLRFESSREAKRTVENMAALIEIESGNRVWEEGEDE